MSCFWGPSETGGFKLFPLGVFRNPVEKNLQSVFPVVPDQQSPFKGKLPVFLLLDNGQFLPYLPCRFRQAEELVPCGDDGFLYLCVVFGNEIHCSLYDLHLAVTGIGTDLVEDAADEQGTVVAFTFARVELMDGIRTALDVPFQGKPGLFLFSSSGRFSSFVRSTAFNTLLRQFRSSSYLF